MTTPVDVPSSQRISPPPPVSSSLALPVSTQDGSLAASPHAFRPNEGNSSGFQGRDKPDLNLLPAASIEDDAVVPGDPSLTAEIENSLVNLSVEDVIDMPFVKPNGGYLVGSLLQKRRFSASAMERLMIEKLWNSIYRVQMQEVEQNLFLFGFEHQIDLKKVIREGPWRFNKHLLILKEIDSPTDAVRSALRKIPIWVHIVDVPPTWLSVKATYEIGIKIGPVLEVDPDSAGVRGLGYLRVRVEIEAWAPLPRGISIGMGGYSKTVGFRFERLENYCFRCGYLDHIEDDCVKAYDLAKKDDIGWRMDLTTLPPIKRISRQQPAYRSRTFGSVSPIEGSVWTPKLKEVVERSLIPYEAPIHNSDRSRKRPCLNSEVVPPGFENVLELDAKGRNMEVELAEEKNEEKVGDDARLRE